jgi:hypothetical protein
MSFQRDALGVHDVEMLLDVLTGRALLLVNGPSLERHACVPHHDNGGRVLTLPEVDTGDEGFIGGRRRAEGVRRALSEANKERTPEWQGTANSPGSFTAPA